MKIQKPIYIGTDHGGFLLKQAIMEHLKVRGLEYIDVGCDSTDIVRYPYYAAQVAGAISKGEADRGILICSTGIGMSVFANRFKGIRASLCTDTFMAKMTRAHNDSNVLCLGGKVIGELEALDILDAWWIRNTKEAAMLSRWDSLRRRRTSSAVPRLRPRNSYSGN